MKSIPAPHLGAGAVVKFGRNRAPAGTFKLHLCSYLKSAVNLPPIPASADYSAAALPVLNNIYLNDQLGDCVIAGGYHIVGTATGNAGDLFLATSDEIIADYSAIGGYNPADPTTDNGCDEPTALNYWTSTGFADGSELAGWLAVDPTNQGEIQAALFLFENLMFGIELPDAWTNPMPSAPGFTWDVAGDPDPEQGHCVIGCGFSAAGVTIDTWGMLGTLTWDAIAKYCASAAGGGLYVMLTPDQINKAQAKAPNGIDWPTLISDFDQLGGNAKA